MLSKFWRGSLSKYKLSTAQPLKPTTLEIPVELFLVLKSLLLKLIPGDASNMNSAPPLQVMRILLTQFGLSVNHTCFLRFTVDKEMANWSAGHERLENSVTSIHPVCSVQPGMPYSVLQVWDELLDWRSLDEVLAGSVRTLLSLGTRGDGRDEDAEDELG